MAEIDPHPLTSSIEEFTRTQFDYIICGGGTAGCMIAARLSENPDVTVGVIEAGKCRIGDATVDTPGVFTQMLEDPEYDWCMYTEPQLGNRGRSHHIPRGKLLGGTSGINAMMYVRGSSQDYDDWAVLTGDEGWSAKNMQHYMKKHQTLEPMDPAITDRSTMPFLAKFHGAGGPVHTSFNDTVSPVERSVIKACEEATGIFNTPADPWSGDHIGFYHTLGSVLRTGPNQGKRSYSARYCHELHKRQRNLHVLCETFVNKILLDAGKATAVSIAHKGREFTISAKREIIVCCGTIKTPQLLELSGIGDPEILRAAGVAYKIPNRGVGANVQDHSMSFVTFAMQPDVSISENLPGGLGTAAEQYIKAQRGPQSCIIGVQGYFPARAILSDAELEEIVQSIQETKPTSEFHAKQLAMTISHLRSKDSANVQVVLLPASASPRGVEHQSHFIQPRQPDSPDGITFLLCVQYPVSRGYIHIASPDPANQPAINPNYGGHEGDISLLAATLRWTGRLAGSQHIQQLIHHRSFPEPDVDLQDFDTARQAARDLVMGEYHICGSVAMGDALDSRLKVKGVNGLRVADASVFPNNVSGNIVSSVYAVAEKAADMIKAEWS